jgi:uncharacterized protein YycO
MRGDVLLYRSDGSLFDRLIAWRTHGPFVHTGVDLGDGTMIDAMSKRGVTRHAVSYERAIAVPILPTSSAEQIDEGITWLQGRVGDGYSWADNADHLLPRRLMRVFFAQPRAYNCSNLVAQYLMQVDPALRWGLLKDTPDLISPNDIARAFGVG